MSVSTKRRRATSPSSSVSGGGDLDDVSSSAPASGRKRKRISNVPPVDTVSVFVAVFVPLFVCAYSGIVFTFACSTRLRYVTSFSTLSGITKMSKEGNLVNFS